MGANAALNGGPAVLDGLARWLTGRSTQEFVRVDARAYRGIAEGWLNRPGFRRGSGHVISTRAS